MKFYQYDTSTWEYYPKITLTEFESVKETPCGYWIIRANLPHWIQLPKKRWISKTSRKRFAYPTKQEALTSFIMRKKRQIQILDIQLDSAKSALSKAENMILEES